MTTLNRLPDIGIPIKGYLSYGEYVAWRRKHGLETPDAKPEWDWYRLTFAAFTFAESQEAILFKLEFGI